MRGHLKISVFSRPARAVLIADRLNDLPLRIGDFLDLDMAVECFCAPEVLLGFDLVTAQLVAPGWSCPVEAAACDQDMDLLIARFVGELAERIALSSYLPFVVARTSERELRSGGHRVFDVRSFIGEPLLHSGWPFRPYDPAADIDWTVGTDIETGSAVYVPAGLCSAQVRGWCELTSNGTAAGATAATATDRAIRELFERDAIRLAWLMRVALAPVSPPSTWERVQKADEGLGWRTGFYHLASRGGAPVWVVFTRHQSIPIFAIGSACAAGSEAGLNHALQECLQIRLKMWLSRADTKAAAITEVRSFEDHILYYCNEIRLNDVENLFRCDRRINRARQVGPEVTLAGAVSMTIGHFLDLDVVRVLHPGLQPIEADHGSARLIGSIGAARATADFRTTPVPFA